MRIVACGDSITYGEGVDPQYRWTSVLQSLVGPGWDVINKGVCGDTTRLGLERFRVDVMDMDPDIVFLQFGHNDANVWDTDHGMPRVSAQAYVSNIIEMEEKAFAAGAKSVIVFFPYVTDHKGDEYRCRLRVYRSVLLLAYQNKDLQAGLIDPFALDEDINEFLLDDGIHLSEEGHELLAQGLKHVFKDVTA